MKARRLVLALTMGLVMLSTAIGAQQVLASPPDIQTTTFDNIFISPFWSNACGFPVQRHAVGMVRIFSFFDHNGNLTREIDQFFRTDTLSANGHSIRGMNRESDHGTYNPDGSVTILATGPRPMYVQPGGGPVWASSGSILMQISADGDVTILRESGLDVGDPSAICAALAP